MSLSDDEFDEEALRLAALKSISKPKYINPRNLISIIPINAVTPTETRVNIKLEPISPRREENVLFEFRKAAEDGLDGKEMSTDDEETDADEPLADENDEDDLDKLMDKLEAEIEGNFTAPHVKKKKRKKVKQPKLVDNEVELVDVKIGKSKPPAPLIEVRESLSPEPKRLRSNSKSRTSSSTRSRSRGRSPLRRSWSPRQRSPRRLRSPLRRSRSPLRLSRSPLPRSRASRSPPPRMRFRSRSRSPLSRRSPLMRRLRSRSRSRSRTPYLTPSPRYRSRSVSPLRRRSPLRRSRTPPRRSPMRRWSRSPLPRRKRSPLKTPPRQLKSPLRKSPPRRSFSPIRTKSRPLRRSLSPRDRKKPVPTRRSPPLRRRTPRRRTPERKERVKEREQDKKLEEPVEIKVAEPESEPLDDPVLEARRKKFQSVPDPSTEKKISLKAVKDTIEPWEEADAIDIHFNESLFDDDDEEEDKDLDSRFKGADRGQSRNVISFRGIREGQTAKIPSRLDTGASSPSRHRGQQQRTQSRFGDRRDRRGDRRDRWERPSTTGALRERNSGNGVARSDGAARKRPERVNVVPAEKQSDAENDANVSLDDFETLCSAFEKELETDTAATSVTVPKKSTEEPPVPVISVKKDLFYNSPPHVDTDKPLKRSVKRLIASAVVGPDDSQLAGDSEDLRSILAKKRKERPLKGPVNNSRLVQTAFQSLLRKDDDSSTVTPFVKSVRSVGKRRIMVVKELHKPASAIVIPRKTTSANVEQPMLRRRVEEVASVEHIVGNDTEHEPSVIRPLKFKLKRSVVKRSVTIAAKVQK